MANKTSSFLDNSPPKVDQIWLNMVTGEVANAIPMAGDSVDATGLVNDQLLKSIKSYVSQAGILCTDTSSGANVYIVNASTPFTNPVLKIGARVRFKTANANTGSSTITAFGGSAITCKKSDGSTNLASGDILANSEVEFVYNGTNWVRTLYGAIATTTNQGVAYLNNPITIANNATDANNDIDFSAGNFQINDGSGQALATAVTKRLDATWSAGSGNGGLFNGTAVPKAINSTYHCYKIYNPTTGAEDSGFLLGISGTAPDPTSVLPSGYTKFERRGSVLTDGSGNIRAFTQTNNRFEYDSNILDLNATLAGSETSIGVSAPAGLRTRVCMALNIVPSGTGAGVAKVYSHNISTTTVSLSNATAYAGVGLVAGAGYVEATTNLSSQIKINAAATSGSPTLTGTINTSAIIDLTLRF